MVDGILHLTHASSTVNLTPTQLLIHLAILHLLKHHFSNHKEFTGSENRESIQHQLYRQPFPYMDPNGNNQPLTIQTHSSQFCPHTPYQLLYLPALLAPRNTAQKRHRNKLGCSRHIDWLKLGSAAVKNELRADGSTPNDL